MPASSTGSTASSATSTGTGTAAPGTPAPTHIPSDISLVPVLGWSIFGGFVLLLCGFSSTLTGYYTDKHESEALPYGVTVVALSIALFAVFLIPIDVYLTPSYTADGGPNASAVRNTLYVLYILIAVFFFIIIPFAYFYYEEEDEDTTARDRASAACRYTSFLVVICIVIFIIGAVLQARDPDAIDIKNPDAKKWINSLMTKDPVGFSISFAISCLTLIGYLAWMTYTAYGLSALPIGLIRGSTSVVEEEADIKDSLEATREKKRVITSKYLSGNKMSKRDERSLSLLTRQERILARQGGRIEARRKSWLRTCTMALRPFSVLFGILFAILSTVFVVSVTMTQLNKIIPDESVCGSKCGFILDTPWVNPLDGTLRATARFFPLDLLLYTCVILYVFLCTVTGVVKLGIRLLWVRLFSIRNRRTPPQALLLMAMILMLSLLAFNADLLTIAPYYTSFGRQVDCKPADVSTDSSCRMTVIATLMNTINVNFPFFGNAFYYLTWGFVAVSIVSALYQGFKQKSRYTRLYDDDSDEEEF